jgi:hypothetical protein
MTGAKTSSSCEPDGLNGLIVIDDFSRVAVAHDFKFSAYAIFELVFVMSRGAGVAFFRDGPMVNTIANVVPV